MKRIQSLWVGVAFLVLCSTVFGAWQDVQYRTTLTNSTLEAKFQAGILYELRDLVTGDYLVNENPVGLSSYPCLFGSSSVNLNTATVNQTVTASSVDSTFLWSSGRSWTLNWSIDGDDLVLQTSAVVNSSKDKMFIRFVGCNISDYTVVAIDNYGVSHEMNAPYNGALLVQHGGTNKCDMSGSFAQSLVTLFEGDGAGWVIEGRDPDVGPSNIMPFGEGSDADIVMCKRYQLTTLTPAMYEVRIRNYHGLWQDGVDPHIAWMENDMGYVPIDQKPQAWVRNINAQSYCVPQVLWAPLDQLAQFVNPAETYLGRQGEYRNYVWDDGYPDYTVTQTAKNWIFRARGFGFHVGVHVNTYAIDKDRPALLSQFSRCISGETAKYYYSSPACADWRAHLIGQLQDIVDSGVEVIYLDEAMSPCGTSVVDGVTRFEGLMLLEEEILAAYPNVVIQTEQFNPLASRHASFALSQMPLGHPLSGYIFSHFIHIVPEGVMISPTDLENIEAFMKYGYILPGASVGTNVPEDGPWFDIIRAFNQYDLVCDSRMPRNANQLSGFAGIGGVTAYFEQYSDHLGLRVYVPGEDPEWVGRRVYNTTTWSGPGAIEDWLIYNGTTLMGLDPEQTYYVDETVTLDQSRFHVTAVPPGFMPYENSNWRVKPQEIVGSSDNSFRIFFTSSAGQMQLHVPDEYDVYVNGVEVTYDRGSDSATVAVASSGSGYSVVRAFKRSNSLFDGWMTGYSYSVPAWKGYMFSTSGALYPPHGYFNHVGGEGFFIGKFPAHSYVHLTGSYGMRDTADHSTADGVIHVNGAEVHRADPGPGPPFDGHMTSFDIDLSSYSGEYAMIELASKGRVGGPDYSDWKDMTFVITDNPSTCAGVISLGYYIIGDFNEDCYLDINDLVTLVSDWLWCVEPTDADCEHPWGL